jgi:hypothetical protein
MDTSHNNDTHKVKFVDGTHCIVATDNQQFGLDMRTSVPEKSNIPVHTISLSHPLSIVPDPVTEFTITYPPSPAKMQPHDLVILIFKIPLVVGFINSIDTVNHTASILPIAVNRSKGAVITVDVLPEVGDEESLYILTTDNSAHAYYYNAWHTVGTDITNVMKALELHKINSAIHVSALDRKRWSSGGNFVGVFDKLDDFHSAAIFNNAQRGDFVLIRHSVDAQHYNSITIYFVDAITDEIPQWVRAHLWDNEGGRFIGSAKYFNLLPQTEGNVGDVAIVESEPSLYKITAINGEGKHTWTLVQKFLYRDFEAHPIVGSETADDVIKVYDIIDNLGSNSIDKPLSANQGRVLAEMMPNDNMFQHLFNFSYQRSWIEKEIKLFPYDNIGKTSLLEYTYEGALPHWCTVSLQITSESLAIKSIPFETLLRVVGRTSDNVNQILCETQIYTELNALNLTYISAQVRYTPHLLLLPGMKIIAGMYDLKSNQFPFEKTVDTGNHKFEGYLRIYIHSA